MNILRALKNAVLREEEENISAHSKERIATPEQTQQFTADPEFPYLVSFSRTGSHWLRMLMEMYYDEPSLRLLFFRAAADAKSFTSYHTHDLDLKVERKNVIYLYREPVETIYSQMSYHGQDLGNIEVINGWADLYARHLHKWLIDEKFTAKKEVLTYEGMRANLAAEFEKLDRFFGKQANPQKLTEAAGSVSKEKIKEKTAHDPRVINTSSNYADQRKKFAASQTERINAEIFGKYPELKSFFK